MFVPIEIGELEVKNKVIKKRDASSNIRILPLEFYMREIYGPSKKYTSVYHWVKNIDVCIWDRNLLKIRTAIEKYIRYARNNRHYGKPTFPLSERFFFPNFRLPTLKYNILKRTRIPFRIQIKFELRNSSSWY